MTRWARALADDIDPVVVDRLVAGVPVASYTTYERREAVRRLDARKLPRDVIAKHLHVTSKQVYRDLHALGANVQRRPAPPRVAARRASIARLVAHGANTREVALLLGRRQNAVADERRALGVATTQGDRRQPRPIYELLRLYGHLLDDARAGAA